MPEGHLYHRYARLQQEIVGHELTVTSPQGRFADEAAQLDGRTLDAVDARGKNLFYRFAGAEPSVVHVHLGMQGVFLHGDAAAAPKPHTRMRLAADLTAWDLIAPSTCALRTTDEAATIGHGLGPDPLDPVVDRRRALANLRERQTAPIGAVLLDQTAISGVGNVFRAEALLLSHIHPTMLVGDVSDDALASLWDTLVALMQAAEEAGEIAPKRIYKQERCAMCDTPTTTSTVAGRTAYTCERCQPLHAEAA